jgi:hypothetical protein
MDLFGFFVVPLLIDAVPFWYFTDRIAARAQEAGVRATWYGLFAVVGWVLGAIGGPCGLVTVLEGTRPVRLHDRVTYGLFLLTGLASSAAVPALCDLVLRMQTARDPDYEEGRPPPPVTRS